MEPFKAPDSLKKLKGNYPNAQRLREAAKTGGGISRTAIARLWLSEGIPFAFRHCPGMYDVIRAWLGHRLSVDPKEISVSGSARIGQSLAPSKIGKPFGSHSDLDLFIVSSRLFGKMKDDFYAWSHDFRKGDILPKDDREREFWLDNQRYGKRNIQRGFLDSKKVPSRKKYATIQNIHQTMWILKEKLRITDETPNVKKVSLRCYSSWSNHLRQVSLSLRQIE